MSPKPKDAPKKFTPTVARQPISESSLCSVPSDAVEGYQERIDRCVEWSIHGSTIRHHKQQCQQSDLKEISFSAALQDKINRSILSGFLDEDSTLSLQEHLDVILPMLIWDSQNCSVDEVKICFDNVNNITDDLVKLLKKAAKANDRSIIMKDLKATYVLRANDSKMTELDEGLLEFKNLTILNLCGNYLSKLDGNLIPYRLKVLELQANFISNLNSLRELPPDLLYLGLARNLLSNDGIEGIANLPRFLTVLDLSDNDIYDLQPLLDLLVRLQNLQSLMLSGNPCSVCAAYARTIFTRLRGLKYLDNREILPTDKVDDQFEPHPHDLRSAYFIFTVIRIIAAPMPPKPEKGATATFHVEMELPLFDPIRRSFLMFRRYESLTELTPLPEDDYFVDSSKQTGSSTQVDTKVESKTEISAMEISSEESDVFARLEPKNSRIIQHYIIFESNHVPWNMIMNFQEPTLRIFCPDLVALRNTFQSTITLKLIFTLLTPVKKQEKKSSHSMKASAPEQRVTIATIKCTLKTPDWSQSSQHFFWDDTLGTQDAIHWGDGDLSALQYQLAPAKQVKGKQEQDSKGRQTIPENLTCHFAFGIDTVKI